MSRSEIRDKVKKYTQKTSVIFWISILNLISFIIILFKNDLTYTLGFASNILIHGLIFKTNLNIFTKYLLSFIFSLIFDIVFLILAFNVRKGKLKPLVITFIIYCIDTLIMFFIPRNLYLLNEKSSIYNILTPYAVHFVVIGYLIYLLIFYNNIVKASAFNKNNNKK